MLVIAICVILDELTISEAAAATPPNVIIIFDGLHLQENSSQADSFF